VDALSPLKIHRTTGPARALLCLCRAEDVMRKLDRRQFTQFKDGKAVQKDSTTTEAHMHTVTFNAEAPEEPSRY
jgi:hypothetical protein